MDATKGEERKLFRGALQPVKESNTQTSYSQRPASKDHVSIRSKNQENTPAREFNSASVPMPFLDPAELRKKMELDRQAKSAEKQGDQRGAL